MSNTIKFGVGGKIVSGKSIGWFLRVEETEEGSGSYLIIVSKDRDFSKYAEGYDYWAESLDEVQGFFKDFKWVVEWFE